MSGRRNSVSMNPLLRKGGVHINCRSATRRNEKHHLDALVDDWYSSAEKCHETLEQSRTFRQNEHD